MAPAYNANIALQLPPRPQYGLAKLWIRKKIRRSLHAGRGPQIRWETPINLVYDKASPSDSHLVMQFLAGLGSTGNR